VHLEEHISSAVAIAVADHSTDFGIVSELPLIDGLRTVPFRNDELVLVLKRDHELAQRTSIAFAAVANLTFIGLHTNSSLHHLLTRAAIDAGATLNWRIHVTSFDAVCAMVAAGLGVSVIPRGATTPYIRSLGLVAVSLTDGWAARQLFLCAPAQLPLHPAAQLLFDHLRVHHGDAAN
jgi:DNA-binding transcriptional LysR family regulator